MINKVNEVVIKMHWLLNLNVNSLIIGYEIMVFFYSQSTSLRQNPLENRPSKQLWFWSLTKNINEILMYMKSCFKQ